MVIFQVVQSGEKSKIKIIFIFILKFDRRSNI